MWLKKRRKRIHLPGARAAKAQMTPLREYERELTRSCASEGADGVPNAAVMAVDAKGEILHSFAAGTVTTRSDESTDDKPFSLDTACWIASCTKVMTTVAALQCVEQGLLSLDVPVDDLLPEFKAAQIVVSVSEEKGPTCKAATKQVTLRQLLTHSSGLGYDFTHPKIFAWRRWFTRQSEESRRLIKSADPSEAYQPVLLFEPGEGWCYSTGIDWAGVMVERVTKSKLEDYMRSNIFEPLGMMNTTFYPERFPHLSSRTASMAMRDDDGALSRGIQNPLKLNVREGGGGGTCYSTARDYSRFLAALLAPTCPLLRNETRELMFQGHLSDSSKKALMQLHATPEAFGLCGNLPIGTDLDYGLGGILNFTGVPDTGRKKGGMQWGGLPNLFWWVSREDGIAGCYFSQLLPPGDKRSTALYTLYEKAVMREFGGARGRL